LNEHKLEEKLARKTQKIDDGVNAQKKVFEVGAAEWKRILVDGTKRKLLTPKEIGILEIAEKMPRQIPTEKQSNVLLKILAKAELEGIRLAWFRRALVKSENRFNFP
jgi:hypothetical protein